MKHNGQLKISREPSIIYGIVNEQKVYVDDFGSLVPLRDSCLLLNSLITSFWQPNNALPTAYATLH